MTREPRIVRRSTVVLAITALLLNAWTPSKANNMSQNLRAEDLFSGSQLVLAKAIESGDMATFNAQARPEDLVKAGAKGMTLLWFAMRPSVSNFEAIRSIIAKGVNPDSQVAQGIGSALDYALLNRDIRFLTVMLDGGLSPNHTYPQRSPLLNRAAGPDGSLAHVKLLVERGAKLDTRAANGESALHMAVSAQRLDVAVYLLERGANANTALNNGVSVAWSVHNALSRETAGPVHDGLVRLRDMLVQRGVTFPPDAPAVVRERLKAGSSPGS